MSDTSNVFCWCLSVHLFVTTLTQKLLIFPYDVFSIYVLVSDLNLIQFWNKLDEIVPELEYKWWLISFAFILIEFPATSNKIHSIYIHVKTF